MRSKSLTLPVVLLAISAFCGIAALGARVRAQESADINANPVSMTVAELSARKPGDDLHVTVTDFDVVQSDVESLWYGRKYRRSDIMVAAYIPLKPKGRKQPEGLPRVVVEAGDIDKNQLAILLRRKSFTGIISNRTRREDKKDEPDMWRAKNGLPEPAWYLVVGKAPPSLGEAARIEKSVWGLGLVALGCFAAGAITLVSRWGAPEPPPDYSVRW